MKNQQNKKLQRNVITQSIKNFVVGFDIIKVCYYLGKE